MESKPLDLSTIDELARTDPLWQTVLNQEANTPQIKLFSLMSRISDAKVFVADTLKLYKANSERLLVHKMQGVPMLVSKPEFWKSTDGAPYEPTPEWIDFLVHGIENDNREKLEKHYPRWVLNQGLVTFCTILDSYLDSTLDAVFQSNPRIMYGVSGAKHVELKKLVELGTVDAVIREIRAKEIRNFSNDDIANRLDYLKTKLSIETDRLFDWEYSDKDMDRPLEGLNLKSLESFYQQRHDIVHRDDAPISTLEELNIVSVFFLNIGAKLALLISQKHHVALDLAMFTNRNERYRLLKEQSKGSS